MSTATAVEWYRPYREAVGHGIDTWVGESVQGHDWLVNMWFGDEPSDGELEPTFFAIELCKSTGGSWIDVTYDELGSRDEVLAAFAQMKATLD